MGKVVSVEGEDISYGNKMTIKVNANLFNETNQIIEIEYINRDYDQGFIEGDLITVFGIYDAINGNTPHIDAKYIVFGKENE